MSESEFSVTCDEHGERRATFICQHLVTGSGLGFNYAGDPENPDDVCPDAWCDSCDAVLEEAGEWTESALEAADIKLACDLCYEDLRARNWRQNDEEFEELLSDAGAYLNERQEQLQEQFRLGEHERYDWDQETGQLVFSNKGERKVVADIVFVGSIATRSNTWLWSWANGSHLEPVKARMREVRRYGEEHSLLKLAAAHWSATEEDGWEMTAVAAYLLNAVGAYRSPSDRGFTFMILTRVDWAQ